MYTSRQWWHYGRPASVNCRVSPQASDPLSCRLSVAFGNRMASEELLSLALSIHGSSLVDRVAKRLSRIIYHAKSSMLGQSYDLDASQYETAKRILFQSLLVASSTFVLLIFFSGLRLYRHRYHHRQRRRYSIITDTLSLILSLQKRDATLAGCTRIDLAALQDTTATRQPQQTCHPLLMTPSDHIPVDSDTIATVASDPCRYHGSSQGCSLIHQEAWVGGFARSSLTYFTMTAEIQIEGLALTLETDVPLSLVVRDQPVVAVFEDSTTKENDPLGQVSDRNNCSDILRLWIGVDQNWSKLFIALAIWIAAPEHRCRSRSVPQGAM
ncbi:hypothetical protein KCU89_g119, partial [Aureobasidium melanogenum]